MAKTLKITIRVTKDEYDAFKLAAGKKTLSEYILSRCIARPRPTVPYELWGNKNGTR
jgi:uncharacterized protein (DUF1778 family)